MFWFECLLNNFFILYIFIIYFVVQNLCIFLLTFAGYFFEPTVFTDVKDNTFLSLEESFGPIMIVSKFEDG